VNVGYGKEVSYLGIKLPGKSEERVIQEDHFNIPAMVLKV
jgi:hypothetical protein